MTRIIAVSTNKGGVLKTSVTSNLAGVLAKADKKVLIIDTDNQGNSSLSFGFNPDNFNYTLYDVLMDGIAPQFVMKEVYKNIDILPSNDDMAFFDFDVLTNIEKYPKPFHLLRDNMKQIVDDYDYILIDTPPNLGLTQGNVLSFAHEVLIPFQPEPYSLRSLSKMLGAVNEFKKKHNPFLEVLGVVGTLIDYRTTLHADIMQKCRAYCMERGIKVFESEITKIIRYPNSIAKHGLPATLSARKNEYEYIEPYINLKGEIENG